MAKQPMAFMSYNHHDNEHDRQLLTHFREYLSGEVRTHTGEEFPIFQDHNDIGWGQNWRERILESLDAVTFLIPIITPSFFKSTACREELTHFLKREKELNRTDLILPVYYVDCPHLKEKRGQDTDELAKIISTRQYADWRKLRLKSFDSPATLQAFEQLALHIRNALQRTQQAEVVNNETETKQETQSQETTSFMVNSGGEVSKELAESLGAEEDLSSEARVTQWKGQADYWYKQWFFEKVSHFLFPGQVNILKYLSTYKEKRDSYVNLFERYFSVDFFEFYFLRTQIYSPIKYFQYIANLQLIAKVDIGNDVNPDIVLTNLGMEFLAYILQEGYENRYAPLNDSHEEPFADLYGTWIGDVLGANYGSLELTFEHPDNLSTLHGTLVFTDHVYGRVQYTTDLEMSGNRIRGFVRSPVALEARESILHPPSSLIGGYLSQDTQELQGVWVTSGDRAGDFVVRIKS